MLAALITTEAMFGAVGILLLVLLVAAVAEWAGKPEKDDRR